MPRTTKSKPLDAQWLRENWERFSLVALAKQAGVSTFTIREHGDRLGLPHKRPGAKARQPKGSTRFDFGPIGEQWLRDHWADYSFPDIAKHYGCSLATLRKWVHSLSPALPDKRGGARVGAGRIKGGSNSKPAQAERRHTFLAPLDEGIARRLKERGIAGAATYAELFDILAERGIFPFVKPWQLTPGNTYYVGECVGPDGVRSTGVTDYETWEEAARSALSLTYKYLPVTLKN